MDEIHDAVVGKMVENVRLKNARILGMQYAIGALEARVTYLRAGGQWRRGQTFEEGVEDALSFLKGLLKEGA